MQSELTNLTARELSLHFRAGELSPVEVMQAVLDLAEGRVGQALNAFCYIDGDTALAAAKASERRWRRGAPSSPIDGIAVSVKDNIRVEGMPTYFGSLAVTDEEAVGPDSPAVARLREAGAVIFGKTCLPDYAHKSVTDSPRTGVTRNPYDLSRTPGGSSGGASAAVAAGIGCMALGTDGGGSIRVPAAVTGIFGFKPSFGRVPHYPRGTFALLSHVGPMTRTVEDAAMMMEVIARPDCRDWCALPAASLDYVSALSEDLGGMRIAFSESLGFADAALDESVRLAIRGAVRILSDLGATVDIACPPDLQQCRETHEIFWATFSARLGRTLGARVGVLDEGLVRLIEAGYQLPKDAFLEAVINRTELGKRTNEFFNSYDAVIGPVFPTVAPRLTEVAQLPPVMQLTSWCNQLGLPAASVYCGVSAEGLPIGLQIVGRQYADDTVLIVSHAFEAAFGRVAPPSIGDVG